MSWNPEDWMRRQRDGSWRSGSWIGYILAKGLARLIESARPQIGRRQKPTASGVVALLFGAFLALILLLAVLAGVVGAVGQAGAFVLLCLVPAAVLLLALGILDHNRRHALSASGTESPQPSSAETAAGKASPYPAAAPLFGQDASRSPSSALLTSYPEKGACRPAGYRQRAMLYRKRIQALIKGRRRGPLADRLVGMLVALGSWEERVRQLADRLALFEEDDLIRRDIRDVPKHIARLRRLAAAEADLDMRCQMERTLAAYEEQLRQLEALARIMRRTRLNLDDTLAAMGTVYSQVQMLNAMDIDGGSAASIAASIDGEVARLNDLLSALGDTYRQSDAERQPAPRAADQESIGLAARRARLESGSARG